EPLRGVRPQVRGRPGGHRGEEELPGRQGGGGAGRPGAGPVGAGAGPLLGGEAGHAAAGRAERGGVLRGACAARPRARGRAHGARQLPGGAAAVAAEGRPQRVPGAAHGGAAPHRRPEAGPRPPPHVGARGGGLRGGPAAGARRPQAAAARGGAVQPVREPVPAGPGGGARDAPVHARAVHLGGGEPRRGRAHVPAHGRHGGGGELRQARGADDARCDLRGAGDARRHAEALHLRAGRDFCAGPGAAPLGVFPRAAAAPPGGAALQRGAGRLPAGLRGVALPPGRGPRGPAGPGHAVGDAQACRTGRRPVVGARQRVRGPRPRRGGVRAGQPRARGGRALQGRLLQRAGAPRGGAARRGGPGAQDQLRRAPAVAMGLGQGDGG
ncbi:unnamed protein product, partial [Prorocentrum cordatum]